MANANGASITVEWMELDTSVDQVEWVEVLTSKLSNCNYKSILLGSQRFVSAVVDAIEANGCRSGKSPTLLGSFDSSEEIFDRIQEKRWDFAIEQFVSWKLFMLLLCFYYLCVQMLIPIVHLISRITCKDGLLFI